MNKQNRKSQEYYRGYTWTGLRDLSRKMGKSNNYATRMMRILKIDNVKRFIDWYIDRDNVRPAVYHTNLAGEYKGYKWESLSDLSLQLGKASNCAARIMNYYKMKSVEEFIDWYIAKYGKTHMHLTGYGEYKGYKWISKKDLSVQLGYNDRYVSNTMSKKGFKTIEEFIDWYIENIINYKKNGISGKYKDYKWNSYKDLSLQLGHNEKYVSNTMSINGFDTVEEFLDWYNNYRDLRKSR